MKEDIPAKSSSIGEREVKEDISVKSSSIGEQKVVERSLSRFWLPLLCILLFASVLRLYALDVYPQRFNQDEMLMAYDGWSIWTTGHDHHGAFLPIFFRSFNDYASPVPNYIVAPFVGIFGLSEESARLPFALMGIATVFVVALLGRRWFNSSAGLLAALFLAIDPWHINYSRMAFPPSCAPFFTVVALYCFTRGTSLFATKEQRRSRALLWLAGSALSLALLTGSYPTLKLEAPLLLCACALAVLPFVREKLSHLGWADFFIWLALYCLFISPLAIAQLQDWNHIQRRFNHISVFKQPYWLLQSFLQYESHYSPDLLFFEGFRGGLAVHPQGVGELFWLEGLLFCFAVLGILYKRHISGQVGFVIPTLLFIWFVTFPVASSLTTGGLPHEVRTYNVLPLPEILAGYGAVVAWEILGRYRWKWLSAAQVALAISAIVFSIFNLMFLSFFFGPPLLQTDATAEQIPYNVGLREVLTKVMQRVRPCDTVWLELGNDANDNQPYMYFLFLTRYPLKKFQSTAHEVDAPWNMYSSIGQVHFGIPDPEQNTVSLPAGCKGKPSRTFFIRRIVLRPGWREVVAVRNRAGVPIWQALVKI